MDDFRKNIAKLSISLSTEEFLDSFKIVIELFKHIKSDNDSRWKEIEKLFNEYATKVKQMSVEIDSVKEGAIGELRNVKVKMMDESEMSLSEMQKNIMDYCMVEFGRMMKEQENSLNFLRDKVREIKPVKDGKDADETKIVQDVLAQIKLPEQKEVILDTPVQIRDKLEFLNGDERLRIEAINNLEERLKDLENRKTTIVGGGGGFSVGAMNLHFIDDETLSGTLNGINTIFNIANIPSPSTSLKIYSGGVRLKLTEDFTVSGSIITFNIAPPVGSILTADYRT